MENNILNEIKPVPYRENFESEYCYVVGVKYGTEGIIPANSNVTCAVCQVAVGLLAVDFTVQVN